MPVHRTLFHARRLVHAGFKVGSCGKRTPLQRVRRPRRLAHNANRLNGEVSVCGGGGCGIWRGNNEWYGVECRCVAEVYTRATIPDVDEGGDDSDEEEDTRTRFIACIVEASVHSKPFFSQSMHEIDEETKRSQARSHPTNACLLFRMLTTEMILTMTFCQAFSEEVRIGIFVHDVHTGETKFDEFEDGAAEELDADGVDKEFMCK